MENKNLLEKCIAKEYGKQEGATLAQTLVGALVGIILSIAVVLPITNQIVASSGTTGVQRTVLNILPVLVAVIPIILVTQLF